MMTHQAGVRTITVGGRPAHGPMQAASGSRGALEYSVDLLDEDFAQANQYSLGATTVQLLPLDPTVGVRDSVVVN